MDEVRSVNVIALDEEKLKFRVIVVFDGDAVNTTPSKGNYNFVIPPLTSFGNSDHYHSALIKLDNATIGTTDMEVDDQVWDIILPGGAHQMNKVNAIEVRLNAPSSQTALNQSVFAGSAGVGTTIQGNFKQLVPLELKLTGSGAGALALGLGPAAPGGDSASGLSVMSNYTWCGDCSNSEGIMCGNPFGSQLTLSNRFPGLDSPTYIVSHAAGAASVDVGLYQYQFTITMIPNR